MRIENVRITNFSAINSQIYVWKVFSFFDDRLPSAPIPQLVLQNTPLYDFDVSACIAQFASFCSFFSEILNILSINFPSAK